MSKPRVIRKVTRYYKDAKNAGRPKVARDKKTKYQIECVDARSPRPCALDIDCNRVGENVNRPMSGIIDAGTTYARVGDGTTKRMNKNMVPVTYDYHFECVPEGAKYLVRFFK